MTTDRPGQPESKPWHCETPDEVLERLGTSAIGFTNAEARKLLAEHGPNALKEANPISPWVIFFAQFKSVVIWVLIGAGALSGILGEAIDAFAIFAIVILNAVVGFYQEFSAEKSISALMRMTAPQAKVRRDGAVTSVAATDLVPGDILELDPGDVVAADARLLNASSLTCVEAMLTGESEAAGKSAETLDQPELPLGDRKNMIFMGTSVAAGSGLAVVVATGMQTEIGNIATLIGDAGEDKRTPLQRKLEAFGRILLWATLAIVVLLFGLGLARGTEFFELFLTSVSLAVAALPESLPAVVTAALSIGVLRMSRRRALVRRLASVETLGSTNVICTDKTGTLTVGQMTVRALFVAGQTYEVTGEGYGQEGDTRIEGKVTDDSHATPLRQMAEILIGCNNAYLERINGTWNVIGDPTEGALLSAGHKAGGRRDELERDMPKYHEIPFDSDRKRHSVVRLLPDGRQRIFVNGAPEMLLARCTYIFGESGIRPMTEADHAQVTEQNTKLAGQALRILGSAFRDFDPLSPDRLTAEIVERDLIFVGLTGLYDPPRPEAKDAVAKCHAAGIRVVMITGDQPRTAIAIARELGIADDAKALSGAELDELTDDMLRERVPSIAVYARVSAEHKLRIVRAWQANDAIVAMTGDGVNDAPAIKGADIGIAMGRSGTEVAKQASDMIITDDNFATIVAAVGEGRGIYENIQKTVQYLLSGNSGELLLMTVCVVIGLPAPLLPIHLLWINLITDGLPALCLATDQVDPAVMQRRPRAQHERIADGGFLRVMLLTAFLTAGVSFAAYAYGLKFATLELARTYAFTALVFAELLRALGARSATRPLWFMNMRSNINLLAVIGASISIQVWSQHSELLARFFKTARMSYQDGLILLSISAFPLIVLEIIKSFQRYAVPDWEAEDRAGAATPSAVSGPDGTPRDARMRGLGRQIPAAAAVVLLAFGSGWLTWSLYLAPGAHYVTQKIERGSVVRIVTASGTVNSATIARVEPHVSGVIQALYCDVTMSVTAGQLCAKLDARRYQDVMDQAKADLAEAETRLENDKVNLVQAQTAFERNEALAKRRAVSRKSLIKSRKTFERAQSQMKRGEATVARLQAAFRAAEIDLASTNIVSPIDGTVIARNVEVGQTAATGSKTLPLFLVAADLTVIHIDANVGGTDINKIKQGAKVSFTVELFPNRPFAGEVIQIGPSPRIIQKVTAYDVVIRAPNPDLLLKPGMMATIGIVIDQRDDVFRVPNQALRYSPRGLPVLNASGEPSASLDGWSRLWILRDGKPTAITVRLGLDDGAYTEIVEGEVRSGDELIIGGSGGVLEKRKP